MANGRAGILLLTSPCIFLEMVSQPELELILAEQHKAYRDARKIPGDHVRREMKDKQVSIEVWHSSVKEMQERRKCNMRQLHI